MFKLSNSNAANPTPADTFTFGYPRGYPVSGDFNGDGIDDVAVYLAGLWQIRLSTGATTSFSFGSGTWPSVVPVAGDWNGDGTDGIDLYCRDNVTCPIGTWMLRNAATAGSADAGTFIYNPGTTPYPVVGDWNAGGTDTVGVRSGTTWLLKNTNAAGNTAQITPFDFGAANDLPIVWAK